MRHQYITYIINELQKEYPTCNAELWFQRFKNYSDDEIYRFANAIERFGLSMIMNLIHD